MDVVGDRLPTPAVRDFDEFYQRNAGSITRAIRSIAGDDAEDIAHEAFAIAFVRWNEVDAFDSPHAWVRVVARRLAMRRRSRDLTRPALERLATITSHGVDSELHADLTRALASLPDRQATAFARHHLDDLPVSAVAAELSCSAGAAKVMLHRGRRRLAEQVGGYSGRWITETTWRTDAIVDHLRTSGSGAHVDVIVEEHLGNRGGRWELVLHDGHYLLNRDDGLRLDDGAFVLRSRHRLDLAPRSTPGTVVFDVSIDGNRLAASQVRNTTTPTSGVPDHVWMNLFVETSRFEWAGVARSVPDEDRRVSCATAAPSRPQPSSGVEAQLTSA